MTKPKRIFQRGSIVLVLFPNSNLKTARLRPALVIQADKLGTDLNQVIVCMITSRVFRANHPSRILIPLSSQQGQQSGLLSDSVVMTDNLATISEKALERTIGEIPMESVDAALRRTLSL